MTDIRKRLALFAVTVLVGLMIALRGGSGSSGAGTTSALGTTLAGLEEESGVELSGCGPWEGDRSISVASCRRDRVLYAGSPWRLTVYSRQDTICGIRLEADYPGDETFAALVDSVARLEHAYPSGDSMIDNLAADRLVRFTGSPAEGMVLIVCDGDMSSAVIAEGLRNDLQDLERFR